MQIYLPIAEISVNMLLILAMGGAVGFLSGLFGVGGGFLLTPLLIFSGIPPAVSIATATTQIVASSWSAALSYWRRRAIDGKLALFLLLSGIIGSMLGVAVFSALEDAGYLDLIISFAFVILLGVVGGLMLTESVRAIIDARRGRPTPLRRPGHHTWAQRLPLKVRFKQAKLYVSAIPVILIGASIGFLGTLLGIGGGFILVPALIYILRVPSGLVVGISLLYIVATMSVAAILHSVTNHSVDAILAIILMVGGVIGAQFGARAGQKVRGEQLRAVLAVLVLAVCGRFLVDLVRMPEEPFTQTVISGATL